MLVKGSRIGTAERAVRTLNVVTKNLAVTLGSTLSKALQKTSTS